MKKLLSALVLLVVIATAYAIKVDEVEFSSGMKIGADNDNLLFQSTNTSAGLLPVAKQSAVTAEASTRSAADTTHTAGIAALDTRVDRNEANILQNFLMDSLNHETDSIPMQDAKLDTYNTATPDMWWVNAAASSGYVFSASEFAPVAAVAGTDMSSVDYHYLMNDSNASSTVAGHHSTSNAYHFELNTEANTDQQSTGGKVNAALDFIRSERGNVRTGWDPQNAMQTTNFTISLWVRFDDGQPAYANSYWGGVWNAAQDDIFYLDQEESSGQIAVRFKCDGTWGSSMYAPGVPNGQTPWYHVVIQKSEPLDTVYLWTNGHNVASTALSGTQSGFTTPGNMFFGSVNYQGAAYDGNNQSSDCQIDDIRIEERLWSAAEIAAVFAAGAGTEADNIGAVAGTDMYVQSSNLLYSTSADETYSWVYMAGNDTNVVTNIQYRTSLDGGVTWLNNILEPSGIIMAGTFTNSIFFAETNFPASGTNLMYEFNTINDDGGGVVRDVAIGRK